jgi:hypothetical protein
MSTVVVAAIGAGTAFAQAPDPRGFGGASATTTDSPQVREARYQIGQMERVLAGAVEHGASEIRDRLAAVVPADMLLTENARVRGFRLDGYGIFFDVEVPSLAGTLMWSFRTLDQNDLGLDSALATLRSYVEQAGANDVNLQQALKRVELQVAPLSAALTTPATDPSGASQTVQPQTPGTPGAAALNAAAVSGAARNAVGGSDAARNAAVDPIFRNPDEAYRTQIRDALIDAMLEHSRGLGLASNEWLTVAARRSDDGSGLTIDTDARTIVLRVRGADLTAFLGGQLTRDEARSRIDARVF